MKKIILGVASFNIINAGLGFLCGVLLARIFDIDTYGRVNLMISFITILSFLCDFGFSNSLVVFYRRISESAKEDFLKQVNLKFIKILCAVLIPLLGIIFYIYVEYKLSIAEFFYLLSGTLFLGSFRYFLSIHQAVGNWKKYNFLTMLQNVIRISITILPFYFVVSANKYFLFSVLNSIYPFLLILVCFFISKKYLGVKSGFDVTEERDFRKYTLINFVINFIIILTMRVDNLLIDYLYDNSSVGIYSAANTLALVFPLLTTAVMKVLLGEASKGGVTFLGKILKFQRRYILPAILVSIVVIVFSKYIIEILFGDRFVASTNIFRVLLIPYIFGFFFTPLESYFYSHKIGLILNVRILQLLIILVSGYLFLSYWGIIGMAYSVLLSRVPAWGYFYFKSLKIIKDDKVSEEVSIEKTIEK
jgi:O-antigen/teichoic acid export membrane protein